jgi:photosynthetic reaction center cytochrome c subunit
MRKSLAVTLIIFAGAVLSPAQQKTDSKEAKTADQVFKNIQSLKGVPADQVIPAMRYFSAALGVQCNFCHVTQPQWAPDKDDKEEKRTARQMIAMTEGINRSNFKGKPEVGCNTCHSGHHEPVALPLMADERKPTPNRAREQKQPTLPTVEQVAQKYEEAIGGRAAIQKLTTRVAKAAFAGGQGQEFQVELWQKAPDMAVSVVTLPNGQSREQGFDGETGWSKNARGVSTLSGPELANVRMNSEFYRDLTPTAGLTNAKVVGTDTVDGRECIVVRGSDREQDFSERLFFDQQDGLLLRRTSIQRTLFGPLGENADYSDYKEVQGVKVPFSVKRSSPDSVMMRTLESVEFNKSIEPSRFSAPKPASSK